MVKNSAKYGFYFSADKGITWIDFTGGLPVNSAIPSLGMAWPLLIAPNGYLLVAPEGKGIYRTPEKEMKTDSGVSIEGTAKEQFSFDLYPNPVTHSLNITFPRSYSSSYVVSATDLSGKEVIRNQRVQGGGALDVPLPVQHLLPGVYLLHICTGEASWSGKFLKQ